MSPLRRLKNIHWCQLTWSFLPLEYDKSGLNRDSNPGPLAPKARIIPLDHWAADSVSSSILQFLRIDKREYSSLRSRELPSHSYPFSLYHPFSLCSRLSAAHNSCPYAICGAGSSLHDYSSLEARESKFARTCRVTLTLSTNIQFLDWQLAIDEPSWPSNQRLVVMLIIFNVFYDI